MAGRVALVGDAAFVPSFLSGQGTSLALVGAYVLAGELASRDHPSALAIKGNGSPLLPRTLEEVEACNRILAVFATGRGEGVRNDRAGEVHGMLGLPDYTRSLPEERPN